MAVFFPALDSILGFLLVLGSPGVGYVVLRCVVMSSQYWLGWKRFLAASMVGFSWSGMIFWIVLPLAQTNVKMHVLVEYFAYAGAGLFALTALASLTNRLIFARVLAQYFPATIVSMNGGNGSHSNPSIIPSAKKQTMIYKPSQLRASNAQQSPAYEEPTLENDVLSLLKEENFEGKKEKKRKISSEDEELLANEPDEDEESSHTRKRSPMQDMGEFAGFEDTLAQLKRDLKDFNENVAHPAPRRNRSRETTRQNV